MSDNAIREAVIAELHNCRSDGRKFNAHRVVHALAAERIKVTLAVVNQFEARARERVAA